MRTVTAAEAGKTGGATVVVDASALGKLLAEERHTAAFQAWHDGFLEAGGRLLAPHLLRYELGNQLVKKARTDTRLEPALRARYLEMVLVGLQFADGVGSESLAPPLTYYDAAYVSLARSLRVPLVSYDDKMLAAAKRIKVRTLSPGA